MTIIEQGLLILYVVTAIFLFIYFLFSRRRLWVALFLGIFWPFGAFGTFMFLIFDLLNIRKKRTLKGKMDFTKKNNGK